MCYSTTPLLAQQESNSSDHVGRGTEFRFIMRMVYSGFVGWLQSRVNKTFQDGTIAGEEEKARLEQERNQADK